MNVWRLIIREIVHRKASFMLLVASVTIAVACLVGAMTLLEAHDIRTVEILDQQARQTQEAIDEHQQKVAETGKLLQDDMRKIAKGLGFNILILPQEQSLGEFNAEGTLTEAMPEEFVSKLANSKIVTINHLLPMVMKKIHWDELDQTVVLTGTRGEVPLAHRDPKKPLLDHVPAGTMVVGYDIHAPHGLKSGDKVTLMGREFRVEKLHPQRGNADDSTIWINLAEAQSCSACRIW